MNFKRDWPAYLLAATIGAVFGVQGVSYALAKDKKDGLEKRRKKPGPYMAKQLEEFTKLVETDK
jgi:hypothetical protein